LLVYTWRRIGEHRREITEREQAQQALRKSQANLAAAQRIARLGSWEWDINSGQLQWSDELYRIFGYSPQQFVPTYENFLDSIRSDDRKLVDSTVYGALYRGKPYNLEYRIVRPDGSERIIKAVAEIVYDMVGNPLRMTGTAQDITERKRAEKDLRRSEARLAEAQRIAHLGDWQWDIKTGQVRWSDETYRIYGLEPGKLTPTLKTVADIFHPEDRHLLRAAIENAYCEDKPHDFEHRIVRPDGEVRWIHRRAEVVRGEEEESLRLIGTVHDITERKAVERELIQRARHAALGEDVGAALNESSNLRVVLWRCAEAVVRHLDAAFTRIWTFSDVHPPRWPP
jgi:PAS domain S-box-containing protein